jgi:uncharacterized protein YdaU (DUF1376 family)
VKNKPPAFQFYVNDWLSSPHTRAMSLAQRGAYIDLLALSWPDGVDASLPLWRLLGCASEQEWDAMKEPVLNLFSPDSGRLFHKKLSHQRKQLAAYHRSQSAKAKKGADARWHKPGKELAMPEDASSSSTATASLTATVTSTATAKQPTAASRQPVSSRTQSPSERKSQPGTPSLDPGTGHKQDGLELSHGDRQLVALAWAMTVSTYWTKQGIDVVTTTKQWPNVVKQFDRYWAKLPRKKQEAFANQGLDWCKEQGYIPEEEPKSKSFQIEEDDPSSIFQVEN